MGSSGTKYRKPDENSNNSEHSAAGAGSLNSPKLMKKLSGTEGRREFETDHIKKKVLRDVTRQEMDGRISRGGIAYHVSVDDESRTAMPDVRRSCTQTPTRSRRIQDYSSEDKSLMAEIMRGEMLSQRVHKARQYEARRLQAEKRRQARMDRAKANVEEKQKQQEETIHEMKLKLDELARRTKENRIKTSNGNTFYFSK